MEDYARILDHLPQAPPDQGPFHREAVAFAVGEEEFKLFELVPRTGAELAVGDRVYIGREVDRREKIQHVKRRIGYTDLTNAAQSELPFILEQIIKEHEEKFVRFFNEAPPLSPRYHMLELLPGLGKKTMQVVLEERKKGPFVSFEDLGQRIHMSKPEKLVVQRILTEVSDLSQKYRIFTAK